MWNDWKINTYLKNIYSICGESVFSDDFTIIVISAFSLRTKGEMENRRVFASILVVFRRIVLKNSQN